MNDYGAQPQLAPGMTVIEQQAGRLVIVLETEICTVSQAIAHLSSQVEIIDLSVSGISAEEMVATLYKEYQL